MLPALDRLGVGKIGCYAAGTYILDWSDHCTYILEILVNEESDTIGDTSNMYTMDRGSGSFQQTSQSNVHHPIRADCRSSPREASSWSLCDIYLVEGYVLVRGRDSRR
jgi:hypothetical protein